MKATRSSNGSKMMIFIDTEAERVLFEQMLSRALNCWQPIAPPALVVLHEEIKKPLSRFGRLELPGIPRYIHCRSER